MANLIHVAVGVVIGDDEKILIAKRPLQVHQGGLWEFPGGKVELGETLAHALQRELREELNITALVTEPLIKIRHTYNDPHGDKTVLLDVHKVTSFSGVPHGNEGQPIQWVLPNQLCEYEFPAANNPIITAINLPRRLLITGSASSDDEYLSRIQRALEAGIRCVQLRVQNPNTPQFFLLAEKTLELCDRYSAKLILNTTPQFFLDNDASRYHCGLHLNVKELMRCEERPIAKSTLFGASCHNATEIAQARKINADYIFLSPVCATPSHPGASVMGWENFSRLIEFVARPVFALGGMSEADLPKAVSAGAQGIAGIGAWWG